MLDGGDSIPVFYWMAQNVAPRTDRKDDDRADNQSREREAERTGRERDRECMCVCV